MNRIILLTVITFATVLMAIAGPSAEAGRWNRGYSDGNVQYGHNGNYGGYRASYGRDFRGNFNNQSSYRNRNNFGNYYSPYQYRQGVYYGSNNGGFYFRY